MGIFGATSFTVMYTQQKYAESHMDEEHKTIILEKYREQLCHTFVKILVHVRL